MATVKRAGAKRAGRDHKFPWPTVAVLVLLLVGVLWWFSGQSLTGYARAATGYGAKNACSCRFLAGRELGSCSGDFGPGMEAVFLSEDDEARSVTAYVPMIHSETAAYREGFGCVLERATD